MLAVCALLPAPAPAAGERLFDIDTYLALERPSEITVSPDGTYLAYTLTRRDLEADRRMSAVWMQPTDGGKPLRITEPGSSAWSPAWSPDGRYLAVLSDHSEGRSQAWLFDRRDGHAQQLTDLPQGVRAFRWSPDGTLIDTFVMFPPGYRPGMRYPSILHIHGGPSAQWDYRFDSESQLFAAQGYVVIQPNPRGSWGYGQAFTDALVRDWGGIDYGDVMAAVDFAIDKGWVDEDRLAVYGWSYGGFMTNMIITRTDRFRAAISGASEALVMANYGHDEWQRLWEEEFGLPWRRENRAAWDHISPFFALDKVTTPTLVVGGEDDWNMPILNSEQLYIVLRRRGIPTQLVVYPGEGHSLSVPSYERDLYEQYVEWLERFVTD